MFHLGLMKEGFTSRVTSADKCRFKSRVARARVYLRFLRARRYRYRYRSNRTRSFHYTAAMSMEAPPTPVSPAMAPTEKKEKKRKRDKDPEKSAKKQKQDESEAADSRIEEGREDVSAEKKKKKRKERKSKDHEDAQVNGAQTERAGNLEESIPQQESHSTSGHAQDISPAHEEELQKHSPFIQRTTSLYLAISPCAADFPLEGLLAEHVSPLLLTYYPPLKGVLLSFSNARLSEDPHPATEKSDSRVLSQCINEYAVTFTWLTADFLLFRPKRGTWMDGYVRLGNESMIGLVCYNYFNAVIEREKMPKEWTWVAEDAEGDLEEQKGRRKGLADSAGYFRDGRGHKVQGRLVFQVEDFDALQGDGGGSVSIMGTLLPEDG